MKIAVISQSPLKKELETKPIPPGWEWVWADLPRDLEHHRDAHLIIDLDFSMDDGRIGELAGFLPAPVLINAVVHTLKQIGRPFIRISAWPGFLERSIHELVTPDETAADKIAGVYGSLGWQYRIVPDAPGMISARILATIINEAYYTLQEKVSTKEEIDTAMKLGTNYPLGPFEWAERIGLGKVGQLLTVLSASESRYLPSEAFRADLSGLKPNPPGLKIG